MSETKTSIGRGSLINYSQAQKYDLTAEAQRTQRKIGDSNQAIHKFA
jgi:uncharacterized protein YbgA (DUF1722 family)